MSRTESSSYAIGYNNTSTGYNNLDTRYTGVTGYTGETPTKVIPRISKGDVTCSQCNCQIPTGFTYMTVGIFYGQWCSECIRDFSSSVDKLNSEILPSKYEEFIADRFIENL